MKWWWTTTFFVGAFVFFVPTQQGDLPSYKNPWRLKWPVESVQGSYSVISMKTQEHPPSWVSFWDFKEEFSVGAWPPRFCHAIHICFIETNKKQLGKFHTYENLCDDKHVYIYPHVGEVLIKDKGGTEMLKYNQQMGLQFREADKGTYDILVRNNFVPLHGNWRNTTDDPVKMDLSGTTMLIMTNSRFCFPHVSKPTGSTNYDTPLVVEKMNDPSGMPIEMSSFPEPKGIKSLFVPPVYKGGKKTVDLLPHLKTADYLDGNKVRQSKHCASFRTKSRDSLKKSIGVVSVDSWNVRMDNTQTNNYVEGFTMKIGTCSWIRLWFTPQSTDYQTKYASDMKLDNTIDLFLDQEFFMPPDDNMARPLSGNSSQIGTFKFRRFKGDNIPTTLKTVEMSYGRDRGPYYPFIEYMSLPEMHENQFMVHVIKAPKCEAVLVPGNQEVRFISSTKADQNMFLLSECTRTFIKNVPRIEDEKTPTP